jgi:transposase
MDLRRFKPLRAAGATYKEIADEVGVDWRTVRKYLAEDGPATPPAPPRRVGAQGRKIDPLAPVVDAWLTADARLRASVIHERLVADYGFDGHYQRVKLYVAEARERIAQAEGVRRPLTGLHRRFEVTPGAQGQVDWGVEDSALARGVGASCLYSFHMTLSYSRDPFCCFTTSADLATFWGAHILGFHHFGGVPASIVYDRTKTVVKRHVAPGEAVPLHPEAAAFAAHYGFVIDVAAAYRPTAKGRVERQVLIVREHVLAGRVFDSLPGLDAAFAAWLPIRRAQIHRSHGEVIAVRAERDRGGLLALPPAPYRVVDRHLRRVGKDCLLSFDTARYSVPATEVTAGMQVELRVTRTPSRSTPPARTRGASPNTAAVPTAAMTRSTPSIGTGCPTGRPGPPPPTRCACTTPPNRPGRPGRLRSRSRSRTWRSSWPTGRSWPPRSPAATPASTTGPPA